MSKDISKDTLNISESEMISVSRDEFIPGATVPADVFVKITGSKFILITRQGSKFSFNDLHMSEREDVQQFYVRKTDYKNCVGQSLTVAGIIVSKSEISDHKKTEFLAKTVESVFKEISDLGFTHESMEHAKTVSHSIQTLVTAKSDLFNIVKIMEGIPNELMRHSMAVSAVSVMIAKGMDWILAQTLEKLALGGLLHDVGVKELPKELIEKSRHMMSSEEVQAYETHVFRGVEVLRSMPSISDDLVAIVYEHHENAIGQGYPRKLRDFKINPLAKIVSLADLFCELVIINRNNPNPRNVDEALNYIEVTLGQPYNKATFNGLKVALNKAHKGAVKIIA